MRIPPNDAQIRVHFDYFTRLARAGTLLLSTAAVAAFGQTFPGPTVPPGQYVFTTLAGFVAPTGNAQLKYPVDLVRDRDGNLYFSDSGNHVIRKLSRAGVLTTVAGKIGTLGTRDGAAGEAELWRPAGLAIDSSGDLYFGDSGSRRIRKLSRGVVSTVAGYAGDLTPLDGYGTNARFSSVDHIDCDGGYLFVADSQSHTIRQMSLATHQVTTIAGQAMVSGTNDGVGTAARFGRPKGVAIDGHGHLYIVDHDGQSLRKMDLSSREVTTVAGSAGLRGNMDGQGTAARFDYPTGLCLDTAGNAYVANWNSHTIRKVTPSGVVTTVAGISGARGDADGPLGIATLNAPEGILAEPDGGLLIADWGNHLIRQLSPDGTLATFIGASSVGAANGIGSAARFNAPTAPVADNDGNVYVLDRGNYSIRKITSDGLVTTLRQGVLASGLAIDSTGNFYLSSSDHQILKLTPDGTRIVIAGRAGLRGSTDGVGTEARFNQPAGIAVDATGNVYVADSVNCTVRKISPTGVVTTLAGQAEARGFIDGTGSAARFGWPSGLAVAPDGTLFVTDVWYGTIRRITPAGVVTTLAGAPGDQRISDGVGSSAKFHTPNSVALDPFGNLIVTESLGVIRKVTMQGVVTTIGGLPQTEGTADGIGTAARFWEPAGVAVGPSGSLYITDTRNNTVRLGQNAPPVFRQHPRSQTVTPGTRVTLAAVVEGNGLLRYQWYRDATPLVGANSDTLTLEAVSLASGGSYSVSASNTVASVRSDAAILSIHIPPRILTAPQPTIFRPNSDATLQVTADGTPAPSYQWRKNGVPIDGATSTVLSFSACSIEDAAAYDVLVSNSAGSIASPIAILGVAATAKTLGDAREVDRDVAHPNGRTYDQVLLTGRAATITADPGQVTRCSFIDLTDDIVQLEFSGAGTLTVILENPSGPATPAKYNQNVRYMKGHASIVVSGADETTNVSIFSVGRITAVNSALFQEIEYDGVADVRSVSINTTNSRFGGLRAANASFFAHHGYTGVIAPDVDFEGPLYLHDLSAFDTAEAALLVASCADVRITGGDLLQANGQAIHVSGIAKVHFVAGMNSHGTSQPAQRNKAVFEQTGVDVTDEIVFNPTP